MREADLNLNSNVALKFCLTTNSGFMATSYYAEDEVCTCFCQAVFSGNFSKGLEVKWVVGRKKR